MYLHVTSSLTRIIKFLDDLSIALGARDIMINVIAPVIK